MIYALILLASLAHGQSVDLDTTTASEQPFSTIDQISISNQGKALYNLQSGRYTQTGLPLFKNGFCIGTRDTCQTTVPAAAQTVVGCLLVSSKTYTTASSVQVTGLSAGKSYELKFAYGQVTSAGAATLTISNNASNDTYGARRINEGAGAADGGASASASFALSNGQTVAATAGGFGFVVIQSSSSTSGVTGVNWQMMVGQGTSSGNSVSGSGFSSLGGLTSVELITGAGTISGWVKLFECQ